MEHASSQDLLGAIQHPDGPGALWLVTIFLDYEYRKGNNKEQALNPPAEIIS